MRTHKQGMTLIEILITVSIIGVLAAFIIPAVAKANEHGDNARVASKMRIAINAFELCKGENGSYPPDVNRAVVPPAMSDYFADLGIDWWSDYNELGTKWDWDEGNNFAYAVSFVTDPGVSLPEDQMKDFDALLDDGVLTTGHLRMVTAGRYQYILEE